MRIEIVSDSDENFKVFVKPMGEVFIATDGENSTIAETEELAIEAIQEMNVPPMPVAPPLNQGKPTPLENPTSRRFGWFDNTSWDDGKRGHQF